MDAELETEILGYLRRIDTVSDAILADVQAMASTLSSVERQIDQLAATGRAHHAACMNSLGRMDVQLERCVQRLGA